MTHLSRFSSILIANRGEIACRVIRTAKALGYRTIAVYSEADAAAVHVRAADSAVCIGPAPAAESYLVAKRIIAAAQETGAEAIHPGYGFLSENADFSRACTDAGIVYIGPDPEAIQVMGNKAHAKRRMIEAGVPCIPGYEGVDQSDETLLAEAAKIELPLMVKAAAGGGGRGMRLVNELDALASTLSLARAEALSSFGCDELILEKAIVRPRHVEVQVFADTQGNTIHLGERDCSVQRRHQKVVEEAPCPVMTPELRAAMGEAAVAAARSINYVGAGTVEFLLAENGEFYFLEMNTRLQVEHPVTELITGLDLVELQIWVAQGAPLGMTQQDVTLTGHAIEVRLYAEDTSQDFLPTSGPIHKWSPPSGEGIRVDAGIASGQEIPSFYDPLVAKIITYGHTREVARLRMVDALRQTLLFGTSTNRDFLKACVVNPVFVAGRATTAFIAEQFTVQDLQRQTPLLEANAIAAVVEQELAHQQSLAHSVSALGILKNWSSTLPLRSRRCYQHGDAVSELWIEAVDAQTYKVSCGEENSQVRVLTMDAGRALVEMDGNKTEAFFHAHDGALYLSLDGSSGVYRDLIPLDGLQEQAGSSGVVTAPMHGQLLEIQVAQGDRVETGQTLAILEAMKMFYEIKAETDGTVTQVLASPGTQVAADDLLISIDPIEAEIS